jgi:hypothetical protein
MSTIDPKRTWLEFGCASGPIYDNCRNAKNSQDHRGHYVGLPNDPNTEDVQWLRPSRFSEKHHSDTNRDHNNPACEIHGPSLNLQETSQYQEGSYAATDNARRRDVR